MNFRIPVEPSTEPPAENRRALARAMNWHTVRLLAPLLRRRAGIIAVTLVCMLIYSVGVNLRNLIPAIFFDGILVSDEFSEGSVLSSFVASLSGPLGLDSSERQAPRPGLRELKLNGVSQLRIEAAPEAIDRSEASSGIVRFQDGSASFRSRDGPAEQTFQSVPFTDLRIRVASPEQLREESAGVWVAPAAEALTVRNRQQKSSPEKMSLLYFILWFGVAVCVVIAVSRFAQAYLVGYLIQHILADVRRQLIAHMCGLSLSFYHSRSRGDLLSRISSDLAVVSGSLQIIFTDLVQKPLMFVIALAIIFVINWWLALITLCFFPILFVLVARFGKQVRRRSHKQSTKRGVMTMALEQLFSGIRTVKSFGMETFEKKHFEERNQSVVREALRTIRARILSNSAVELASHVGVIVALGIGGYYLIIDELGMTIGELIAFVAALNTMYTPVKSLARAYATFQESLGAMHRVTEIFHERPTVVEAPDAKPLPQFERSIEFRHVHFSYGREQVLEDIDVEIPAGSLTAIVGPTGAGKSTLVDLILRFYDPTEGQVLIDGVDIRTVTLDSLLAQISIVSQDPFLFDTTIRNNIRYGRPDATQEEIEQAARAANIHDFIASLPDGYDTVIGDRGTLLSGGQRQRVTIARALLKNAPILILDEATSSLDTESERAVQDALQRLIEVRSTIAIAHRLSTIRNADRILVLDSGRLVESGTFDELVERGGLFERLQRQQFAPDTETRTVPVPAGVEIQRESDVPPPTTSGSPTDSGTEGETGTKTPGDTKSRASRGKRKRRRRRKRKHKPASHSTER